jgi:hypothetical protein
LIGQHVSFNGRAENAKGGAVVILRNQEVIYIRNLSFWEDTIVGTEITVKGTVQYVKYIPEPEVSMDGAISQGAVGLQYVLDDAQWYTSQR